MNILIVIQMGDTNCRYHIEGLLHSEKIERLILLRDRPMPAFRHRKLKVIAYKRPNTKIGILIKLLMLAPKIIKSEKVEMIFSFNAFPYGIIALLISKIYSLPCHIGFIGSDVHRYKSLRLMRPLFKLLKTANVITVTGKKMLLEVLDIGFKEKKIHILPNAIPFENIKVNPIEKVKYDFIFVGYLQKVKDVGTIINAVGEAVRLSNMHLKLCIVGDGPQKEILKRLAKQQPEGCSIDFVGYKSNPFEFLKQGRIFVMASINEGLPFALIEAMSVGLVPVVTPVGSITEIIKHGVNGFLFEIGNYKTAANFYIELIKDKKKYERMRKNVLQIKKMYSIENATNKWNEIIDIYNK